MRTSTKPGVFPVAALRASAWILAALLCSVPVSRAETKGLPPASADRIARDLRALCSSTTGRTPGSPGFESGLEYAESTLMSLGLSPRRQRVHVHRWIAGTLKLTPLRAGESPLTLHSLARSGGVVSGNFSLLDLGEGTREELREAAPLIPGKILLLEAGNSGQVEVIHRLEQVDRAAAAGAAAVLFLSPLRCELQGVVAWNGASAIPAYSGRGLGRLKEIAAADSSLVLRTREEKPGALREVGSANLIAELKGSSPAAGQILLSAHLDAWNLGQGALDNAAGVCVLLEAARLLSAHTPPPEGPRVRRTIRFVLFSGEELALEGSRAYLRKVREGKEEAPSVVVNLEMCESPAGFVIHSGESLTPFLQRVVLEHRELGLDAGVVKRLDLYSDHMPFLLAGFPSFTLAYHRGERALLRAHTVYDRMESIDPHGLARSAELVAATLLELAEGSVPIPPRLEDASLRELFSRNDRELSHVRSLGY